MNWTNNEVRKMRNRLNLNQADFAKLLGVDIRSVNRWENGLSRPTGSAEAILSALKKKLDTDPDSTQRILTTIGAAVAIGGLAYLIIKLLDALTSDEKG
jgi:transcriptional regulator with XRE-family HTH domain